jgi:hypothetical protein
VVFVLASSLDQSASTTTTIVIVQQKNTSIWLRRSNCLEYESSVPLPAAGCFEAWTGRLKSDNLPDYFGLHLQSVVEQDLRPSSCSLRLQSADVRCYVSIVLLVRGGPLSSPLLVARLDKPYSIRDQYGTVDILHICPPCKVGSSRIVD